MLTNYHEINENETVETFLKGINDKKNSHYIILTGGADFVDFRTIALKVRDPNEKLKHIKKTLSKTSSKDKSEHLMQMIESGDRVIKTNDNVFDFIDALKYILENHSELLDVEVRTLDRKEIFALNEKDMISTAKNLLLNKNVNLLPVIKNLEVVGEIRTFDLLASDLFQTRGSSNGDLYNEKHKNSVLNLSVDNIMNKKPHTIEKTAKLKDAVEFMINKSLPSVIVTDNGELHSIISHKDIFKLIKKVANKKKYLIEFTGISNLFEDEVSLVESFAEKSMDKITKMSDYDLLKVSFKSMGSMDSHQRKIQVHLLISHGKKVITIQNEISAGTSDEITNDKVKGKWNIPALVQETFKNLEKKVLDEKRKSKR